MPSGGVFEIYARQGKVSRPRRTEADVRCGWMLEIPARSGGKVPSARGEASAVRRGRLYQVSEIGRDMYETRRSTEAVRGGRLRQSSCRQWQENKGDNREGWTLQNSRRWSSVHVWGV